MPQAAENYAITMSMFIKIGEIKGEASFDQYVDHIGVLRFQWGVAKAPSQGIHAFRAPRFRSFVFTKYLDKASPVLFQSCCSGTMHPTANFAARRADPMTGAVGEHLKYKFTNVLVTGVRPVCASTLDELPLEEVTLAFSKCELDYSMVGGGTYHGGWDLAQNAKV